MPFGPDNVLWSDSAIQSFEDIFAVGGEDDFRNIDIAVPAFPDASDGLCLLTICSATNGWNINGPSAPKFIDSLSVVHTPDVYFNAGPTWPGSNPGNSFAANGGTLFVGYNNVDTAGGTLRFYLSSQHLSLITGTLFVSGHAAMAAVAVDTGHNGICHYGYRNSDPALPTINDAVSSVAGGSQTTTATALSADPNGIALMVAAGAAWTNATAGATFTDTPAVVSTGVGWQSIISEDLTFIQAGGDGSRWQPTALNIAVYDPTVPGASLAETWSIASPAYQWQGHVGAVAYGIGARETLGRSYALIIG